MLQNSHNFSSSLTRFERKQLFEGSMQLQGRDCFLLETGKCVSAVRSVRPDYQLKHIRCRISRELWALELEAQDVLVVLFCGW